MLALRTHLGAIGELVGRQIDLAKAALAYEPAEGVVADRLEVLRRELTARRVSVHVRGGVRSGAAEVLLEELFVRVCELLPMSVQAMRCDAMRGALCCCGAPSSSGPGSQPVP